MNPAISRVGVLAKPHRDHREYEEWEIARVMMFVQADNRDDALRLARELLTRHRFELLNIELCDRIIENRVREQGGEILALYEVAQLGRDAIKVFPQNFGAGRSGIPAMRPPRVTEEFIDHVVADVGGVRLATDDVNRKADYRIGEWLFELKDLQEEGLGHVERQRKLAELFAPHANDDQPLMLDPTILPERKRREFFNILSSPIKGQVKSASKQIRATKQTLGENGLQGGLIYLNTGYGSFPQDEFGPAVERYVKKDTSQIEAIFCISTWSVTNGFDSYVFFETYPSESPHSVVRELRSALAHRFEAAMTQFIRGTLSSGTQLIEPLSPVAFNVDGLDFSWMPPSVPRSWNKST